MKPGPCGRIYIYIPSQVRPPCSNPADLSTEGWVTAIPLMFPSVKVFHPWTFAFSRFPVQYCSFCFQYDRQILFASNEPLVQAYHRILVFVLRKNYFPYFQDPRIIGSQDPRFLQIGSQDLLFNEFSQLFIGEKLEPSFFLFLVFVEFFLVLGSYILGFLQGSLYQQEARSQEPQQPGQLSIGTVGTSRQEPYVPPTSRFLRPSQQQEPFLGSRIPSRYR